MAAKWNPLTDPIGTHEHLGRRLFNEPMLKGAKGQPSFSGLDLRHFEESREDRQFSMDRLGQTSIVGKVKAYLVPRAQYSARKSRREFNGWIVVTAKQLATGFDGKSYTAVPSPMPPPMDDNELEENKYHSHCDLPNDMSVKANALFLRQIFYKGKLESVDDQTMPPSRLYDKITQALRRILGLES